MKATESLTLRRATILKVLGNTAVFLIALQIVAFSHEMCYTF